MKKSYLFSSLMLRCHVYDKKNYSFITEAATRAEFPNLILPSSSSHATPPQSKVGTNYINKAQEQWATVPGSSKSAAVAKVAGKKAASRSAAGKKRARGDRMRMKTIGKRCQSRNYA